MLWLLRQSAARQRCWLLVGLAFCLTVGSGTLAAAGAASKLQLEVFINGVPTNQIGSFVRLDDGRIGADPAELGDLGLKPNGGSQSRDIIFLDELPSASYRYEERLQQLFIQIDNSQRVSRAYNASDSSISLSAQTGLGAVLNYSLLLSSSNLTDRRPGIFNGDSLSLDARGFSPYGTLDQTALVRVASRGQAEIIRLDSIYRYSDQERLTSYSLGDTISGALPWTRPIRIGGVQAQSNFSLRPDLITAPLPNFSGSAAVPSTVDVYVDNIKTFSQDVDAGPFSLLNVPVTSGAGNASLVLRDASGHETRTIVPFYSSPKLLAPGLASFSLEAGFPRIGYGDGAGRYLSSPVAAATLRRGITDWFTLEGHAEAADRLAEVGAGFVATSRLGTFSGAGAASQFGDERGYTLRLGFETRLLGVSVQASSARTFGEFNDLSSYAVRALGTCDSCILAAGRPARELDYIAIGSPVLFDRAASLSASFVHSVDGSGFNSSILSASWSRSLPFDVSAFATAFVDFGDRRSQGAFVGMSRRLFDSVSVSTSLSSGSAGVTAGLDAIRPLTAEVGDFGWRFVDAEGAAPHREISVAYRAPFALLEAGVTQGKNGLRASVSVDGSVVAMGSGVFLANRVDDAFAVVSVGVPGVPVKYENQKIGVTDADGMLLVPNLRSYDRNRIEIDPSNLPVDAEIPLMRSIVAPADRSGVLVDFAVRTDSTSALVVFTDAGGAFIQPGSLGKSGKGEEFTVGYDGQAFLRRLDSENSVTIETGSGSCEAKFAFKPRANEQIVISPVVCGGARLQSNLILRGSLQ